MSATDQPGKGTLEQFDAMYAAMTGAGQHRADGTRRTRPSRTYKRQAARKRSKAARNARKANR